MSYKKFENNDIFYNVIKTKPRFEFKIWGGKAVANYRRRCATDRAGWGSRPQHAGGIHPDPAPRRREVGQGYPRRQDHHRAIDRKSVV